MYERQRGRETEAVGEPMGKKRGRDVEGQWERHAEGERLDRELGRQATSRMRGAVRGVGVISET